MTLNWENLAATAALVAAGCALCSVVLRRALRRAVAQRLEATDRQLSALSGTVKALQAQVDKLGVIPELHAVTAAEMAAESAEEPAQRDEEEVTPEMMAVLAAAAAAFLGKKVRILSAKMLSSPQEAMSSWSQQGRVFVQASHNLRSRG